MPAGAVREQSSLERSTLLCHLRAARVKARECAIHEALCLLEEFDATAPKGGPLGDQKGIFWIEIPRDSLGRVTEALPHLGYTESVELLEPAPAPRASAKNAPADAVRWRGQWYRRVPLYEEDAARLREEAPDRRLFAIAGEGGETRLIRGYRGDGGPLSRRGLAVYDARMLVNLVHTRPGATFLDPFAGVGGIVIEALERGYQVLSCDIDPILRPGLERLGATHHVCDARRLPFDTEGIDAIATEPPYDEQANEAVLASLSEMVRVLRKGGRLSMLAAAHQSDELRRRGAELGLTIRVDLPIDRKGLDCVVLAWTK